MLLGSWNWASSSIWGSNLHPAATRKKMDAREMTMAVVTHNTNCVTIIWLKHDKIGTGVLKTAIKIRPQFPHVVFMVIYSPKRTKLDPHACFHVRETFSYVGHLVPIRRHAHSP
jgi:hypothetical protein